MGPLILEQIIEIAKKQKSLGRPMKAIFDLDSTLFDVSPRISKIFQDFAKLPEVQRENPEAAQILAQMTPDPSDFGVRRTLERVGIGLTPSNETFVRKIVEYWHLHFFSNAYLKYDLPYPGAQDYVNDLYKAGADILYLTGRDIPRMWDGTVDSLKAHGFPLSADHANLVLKPDSSERDSAFKKKFFMNMDRSSPEVWFFENEPANIHLVRENSPHIKIIFVDTVHFNKSPLPGEDVPKISGFI